MDFSIWKMLEKVIKSGIQLFISWLGTLGLEKLGVTFDPVVLAGTIYVALEGLRNLLKIKLGIKWL